MQQKKAYCTLVSQMIYHYPCDHHILTLTITPLLLLLLLIAIVVGVSDVVIITVPSLIAFEFFKNRNNPVFSFHSTNRSLFLTALFRIAILSEN